MFQLGADLYGDLWNTTKSDISDRLITAIPTASPLLEAMFWDGKYADANEVIKGKRLVKTVVARDNESARFIAMDGMLANRTVDLTETMEVEVKTLEHSYTLATIPLAINKQAQIADILELNEDALRNGLKKMFAKCLFRHGTTKYEFNGLRYLVSDQPYQPGLIIQNMPRGGVPGDRFEFWRNRVGIIKSTAGWFASNWSQNDREAAADKLVLYMTNFLRVMNYNGEHKVNMIVCSPSMYYLYQTWFTKRMGASVMNQKTYKTDAGFPFLEFEGLRLHVDNWIPGHRMYFLSTKEFNLDYLPGFDFYRFKEKAPQQLAESWRCIFVGNFSINRARNQGVLLVSPDGTMDTKLGVDWLTKSNVNLAVDNITDYFDPDYANSMDDITDPTLQGDLVLEREGYSASGSAKDDYQFPTHSTGGDPVPHQVMLQRNKEAVNEIVKEALDQKKADQQNGLPV